jgi:hypothetical protein
VTSDRFREYLDQFGLSQHGAARFFGVDERVARRWATGDLDIPRSVEMTFMLMDEYGLDVDDMESLMKDEETVK